LIGAPVDLKTWADVARSRIIVRLLLVTMLQMSGQFVVFAFMGPLLTKLTQAGPDAVGLVFAICFMARDTSRWRLSPWHWSW
jgi:MFS transporter, DHA1 family, inner membrane transport protein